MPFIFATAQRHHRRSHRDASKHKGHLISKHRQLHPDNILAFVFEEVCTCLHKSNVHGSTCLNVRRSILLLWPRIREFEFSCYPCLKMELAAVFACGCLLLCVCVLAARTCVCFCVCVCACACWCAWAEVWHQTGRLQWVHTGVVGAAI